MFENVLIFSGKSILVGCNIVRVNWLCQYGHQVTGCTTGELVAKIPAGLEIFIIPTVFVLPLGYEAKHPHVSSICVKNQ